MLSPSWPANWVSASSNFFLLRRASSTESRKNGTDLANCTAVLQESGPALHVYRRPCLAPIWSCPGSGGRFSRPKRTPSCDLQILLDFGGRGSTGRLSRQHLLHAGRFQLAWPKCRACGGGSAEWFGADRGYSDDHHQEVYSYQACELRVPQAPDGKGAQHGQDCRGTGRQGGTSSSGGSLEREEGGESRESRPA